MTDKFALLERIASDWWWEMDAEYRFIFISERFTEVFGWPSSAVIGKRRTALDRSDYGNAAWQHHLDDLAHRRPFRDFETTFVDASGALRPVKISGIPMFATDGAFQGYLGVGHDLTELRRRQNAIEALSESLTSVLENIDQGIALFDQHLRIVTYNRRLAQLLQINEAEIAPGTAFENLVMRLADHGEYGPAAQDAIKSRLDMIRTRERQVVERKRSDGKVISVVSTPIDTGGTVLVYSDVTELREREARLLQREESFRHLFVHSPFAKWVYDAKTLKFLEVNNAAIARYGYSREEFLGMTIEDIRPAEEVARLEQFIKRPVEERYQAKGWKHRCKDGRVLDVDVFIRDLDFEGQAAHLAVVTDNTAQKEAESLAQRIFETSQDIIFVSDENRRVVRVSPSSTRILGYRPEEMAGRYTREFIFQEDLEMVAEWVKVARSGQGIQNFKCRYLHKAGHVVPLMWTGKWSEVDRRYFFIGRDMTEYDRAQQQLRQAQKMEAVGQLTGGVAHDFNNILMVIQAKVESIEEEHPLNERMLDDVKAISRAVQRAADLTQQLLAFSRKQPLRPQHTNINDLVAETGKLLRRALGEQVEMEAILADDLWNVEVDRAQFEAALVNLCINARDAMPRGGRLLIESRNTTLDQDYVRLNPEAVAGDHVQLSVTDTGVGIPAESLDKVLEPFFTTKSVGKGTGLGLSMVYGFIKQSKGHLRIYSEVGLGTTIKLFLPRSMAEQDRAHKSEFSDIRRGTERVLVVEDDADVRASVVRQLQSLGYVVTEAADGQSGLAAFATAPEPFDVLLTDVVMPGSLSGKGLADEVSGRWPGTKVVFMSGYTENAIIHHGRIDEGVRLLSKPFRRTDLAKTIREALDA
jgi:PAS domain S-box-containing protein